MTHHHQAQPLLTAEEEIALARRVRAGGPDGLAARNELVERNMRLVIKMAAGHGTSRTSVKDLIQEGAMGLMAAADRYDPDARWTRPGVPDAHGIRFSTFARYWIFRSIVEACRGGRLVRLPRRLWDLLRRDPDELTAPQRSWVRSTLVTGAVYGLDAATTAAARHEDMPDLDGPETVPVMAALAGLPDPYRAVLRRRMAGETLGAIGSTMGVGKDRVRQIQADAVHLLRRVLGVPSVDPRRVRSAERRRIYEIERTRRPAARLKGGA